MDNDKKMEEEIANGERWSSSEDLEKLEEKLRKLMNNATPEEKEKFYAECRNFFKSFEEHSNKNFNEPEVARRL